MRPTGGFWGSVGCLCLLGVGSLFWWVNLGYCYFHSNISCLSPLSGFPLSMR